MNKKIIMLGIIVLTIVMVIGVTFALWQITLKQETTNTISTSCFKITFEDQNNINLSNAYPITNEEGKKLMPYTFTIRNTCDAYASFQVNLEVLNTTTLNNLDYIKVMLDQDINLLTENTEVEKTLSDANIAYKLDTGYLDANGSVTYTLRLWMSEDTPTDETFMNQVFQSKITVISTYEPEYDREAPTSNIEVSNLTNQIQVDARKSFDNKKVKYYHYSLDGENYIRTKGAVYTFDIGKLEYGSAVDTIKTLADSLSEEYTVYVKTEDEYGNLSEVVSKTILSDFAYDESIDNNLRYIGENPNNYVSFNNELWRIIGVMNNVEDREGNTKSRIKLVRDESIGAYSWDSSASNINIGKGVNEWSEADLMKLLNPGYESKAVGGSLYWNKLSGTCYSNSDNSKEACDFRANGLSKSAKEYIEEIIWVTGTTDGIQYINENIITSHFYEFERSNNTGKICTAVGYACNDTVVRTSKWLGKVGIIYPSDYGYATSGGETMNRGSCLFDPLYNWHDYLDCISNNWLYRGNSQWLLFPQAVSYSSNGAFRVNNAGRVNGCETAVANDIFPSVFISTNVKIFSGLGTKEEPFELSL